MPVIISHTVTRFDGDGVLPGSAMAIWPMGIDTEHLGQLRPASFHLKSGPPGAVQYGAIAEEVDRVYPELVIRDPKAEIQGIRDDELPRMLLYELQKQQKINVAQALRIYAQSAAQKAPTDLMSARNDAQATEIRDLKHAEIHAGLLKLQPNHKRVAHR